jgi:hypothetical protein
MELLREPTEFRRVAAQEARECSDIFVERDCRPGAQRLRRGSSDARRV